MKEEGLINFIINDIDYETYTIFSGADFEQGAEEIEDIVKEYKKDYKKEYKKDIKVDKIPLIKKIEYKLLEVCLNLFLKIMEFIMKYKIKKFKNKYPEYFL